MILTPSQPPAMWMTLADVPDAVAERSPFEVLLRHFLDGVIIFDLLSWGLGFEAVRLLTHALEAKKDTTQLCEFQW